MSKKENNDEKQVITFANGITVKTMFDGDLIKLGINVAKFCEENPINEQGYINIDIKKSKKTGEYYAVQNNYNKKS